MAVTADDAKLAERAKGGDTAAYEKLVRGYQEVAFRTAYLITGDASEAEEATQEALVKAYRALGRFRTGARFRPWLLAIVANEARNQRRTAARRAGLFLRAAQEGTTENSHSSPMRRPLRRSGEKSCSRPRAACARRRGGLSAAATSWASPKKRRPRSWVAREEPSSHGSRGP